MPHSRVQEHINAKSSTLIARYLLGLDTVCLPYRNHGVGSELSLICVTESLVQMHVK